MRFWCYFLLLIPLLACADVYQWQDSKGVTHFSDVNVNNATQVNLGAINSTNHTTQLSLLSDVSKDKTIVPKEYYSTLQIVNPANNATLFNNSGRVALVIAVSPNIRREDTLIVLLDGKIFSSLQHGLTVTVDNVERGSHTLQVQILSADHKPLIISNSIQIFMRRPMLHGAANSLTFQSS